ncbi:MAG: CRISPR-associated endonuclease Cas2 [Fimbriimonadaceae bacterium]|nr:CRISPR-associated endonuclease Cas2 [Fimbriimonadaceae bacterium]
MSDLPPAPDDDDLDHRPVPPSMQAALRAWRAAQASGAPPPEPTAADPADRDDLDGCTEELDGVQVGTLYLVSYDIPCDRRRAKLAKALRGYGERVQYSVFECRLNARRHERLLARLRELLDPSEDHVRVWTLCGLCDDRTIDLGLAAPPPDTPDLLII